MSCGPFLILVLMHAVPAIPATMSDREVAERAEAEFQEGVRLRPTADKARPHFQSAAEYFDELRRRGAHNAALYRNLGNAYLLAGDLPHAILSYRRGLRLAPNDLALRDSLAEARERVVYPASGGLGRPRSDARPPWLPHSRAEWLVISGGVCYVLAWACLTRWLMVRRGRLLVVGLIALLLAGLLSVWLILRTREERGQDDASAGADRPRRRAAASGKWAGISAARYDTPINRGVEGRLLFERGGWVQIELAGGEIGWVPREAVLVDTP